MPFTVPPTQNLYAREAVAHLLSFTGAAIALSKPAQEQERTVVIQSELYDLKAVHHSSRSRHIWGCVW